MDRHLILLITFFLFAHTLPDNCGGTYRWDNKILIDHPQLNMFMKHATSSSIHVVVNYARPANSELGTNRGTIEQKKITVTALLIGLGKEDDEDYHLILCSLNKKDSLIAEIPDPSCPKLSGFPGLLNAYTKARKFVEDNIDPTPGAIHYIHTPVKVKVTGVLFFDRMAHGNGHAINGIEIHPVLKIVKAP